MMSLTRCIVLTALWAFLLPRTGTGQSTLAPRPLYPVVQAPPGPEREIAVGSRIRTAEVDEGGAIGGAVVLGLVGWFAGGFLASGACGGGYECLGTFFYGAALGGSLGIATGAHLGNDSRGNLAADATVSVLTWMAGWAMANAMRDDGGALILILLPFAQIGLTVSTEINTSR